MKRNFIFCIIFLIFLITIIFTCSYNPLYGGGGDLDLEPPLLQITSPNNSDLLGRLFTIQGKADDDGDIDKIKIETTGYSKTIKAKSSWSINIDASDDNLADGDLKFTVTLSDASGKKSKKYLNVTIDKTGPVIQMLNPAFQDNPQPLQNNNINFDISVTDLHGINQTSTNNKLIIYRNDDIDDVVFTSNLELVDPNNDGIWTTITSLNTNTVGHTGLAKLRVTFEDMAPGGNIGILEKDITLSPEQEEPNLIVTLPDPDADPVTTIGRYLNLVGYAYDNSEIYAVYYTLKRSDNSIVLEDIEILNDKTENREFFEFSEMIDTNALGLTTDIYTLELHAEDNLSNESSDVITHFQIDATMPTLTILDSETTPAGVTPEASSYHKDDFTIEVQCSMSDATVEYKVLQTSLDTGWNPWGAMTKNVDIFTKTIDISSLKSTYSFTDGAIIVKLKATKDAKFTETSRIFNIDTTSPTITIISHVDNQHVNGGVTLTGSVFDRIGILDNKVEVFNPLPSINDWEDVTVASSLWSYIISTDTVGEEIETKFNVIPPATSTQLFRARVTDKANNVTIQNINLVIDPGQDIPKVTLLTPSSSGQKISGNLSILATMDDDDYPLRDMTANITVYDDVTLGVVQTKDYSKTDSGFPNLSMIVDTTTLVDGRSYTIRLNGTDWHGKTAAEVAVNFIVDKNTPIVTLTSPVTNSYLTDTITFSGTVKDENDITSFTLSYIDENSANQTRNITLPGSFTMEGSKKVWTFTASLNASSSDTELDGTDIDWGDDEWGNNTHLFTIRAADETGLIGYQYIMINLDNHVPEVAITSPSDAHIIEYGSTNLEIKGSMNDTPSEGISYTLIFNMLKITVDDIGAGPETILKDWTGSTVNFAAGSTPENFTYNWNFTSFSDDEYIIRIYTRDNALNEQNPVSSINVIKNSEPPIINTINFTPETHYNGTIEFTVNAQDRGSAPANGLTKLELLVDDILQPAYTINYTPGSEPLTINETVNFDTAAYGSDGLHEISFKVTDKTTNISYTKSAGTFLFDNGMPTISTPVYYTLGFASPITYYSTYISFTALVSDTYSLSGDNPQFRVGTTSGGFEILDWSYFSFINWNGQSQYTAEYNNYIDLFSYYPADIYITIRSTDTAGNVRTSTFTLTAASTLPNIDFDQQDDAFISDRLDSTPGNGSTTVTGTADNDLNYLWIKVDSQAEEIVDSYGGGTFSNDWLNTNLSDGYHTFRIRATRNGIQNIVTRTFRVDNSDPIVFISDTVTYTEGSGYVESNNLSGTVRFSGTFSDNNGNDMDKDEANLQININSAGWVDIPLDNIVHYYNDEWTWFYDWNSETLSSVVGNNITIQVQAQDLCNNTDSSQITKNVIPYISSITSTDTLNYPVYDVKYYQNLSWANHNNRRYSLRQGSPISINGYNLKYSSTTPGVTLNSYSFTPSYSDIHRIDVTIPANDNDGKTGNLTVTTQSIASTPVKLNIWKFVRIGDDYDTFDSRSFDMSLTGTGTAFATFSRDHRVPPKFNVEQVDDYCTYRIDEGASTAYNNFGSMDPMFFTANNIMGNYRYMASCLDEWT
ncbi:MAG: hypothetical protein JXB50_12860, partial [Spirochaetes bacterium]|nr:hypothetical protein [Spirochaetota bacterium]